MLRKAKCGDKVCWLCGMWQNLFSMLAYRRSSKGNPVVRDSSELNGNGSRIPGAPVPGPVPPVTLFCAIVEIPRNAYMQAWPQHVLIVAHGCHVQCCDTKEAGPVSDPTLLEGVVTAPPCIPRRMLWNLVQVDRAKIEGPSLNFIKESSHLYSKGMTRGFWKTAWMFQEVSTRLVSGF